MLFQRTFACMALALTGAHALCGSTFDAKCAGGQMQGPVEINNGECSYICVSSGANGAERIYGNTQVGEDCTRLEAFTSQDCSGPVAASTDKCNRNEGVNSNGGPTFQSFRVSCD